MQKIILYAALLLCAFVTQLYAQTTFEDRARKIAETISKITNEEKEALKREVEGINALLDNGTISLEKAEAEKIKAAEKRAKNIETRLAAEEAKLNALVKGQVDGSIATNSKPDGDTIKMGRGRFIINYEKAIMSISGTKVTNRIMRKEQPHSLCLQLV